MTDPLSKWRDKWRILSYKNQLADKRSDKLRAAFGWAALVLLVLIIIEITVM